VASIWAGVCTRDLMCMAIPAGRGTTAHRISIRGSCMASGRIQDHTSAGHTGIRDFGAQGTGIIRVHLGTVHAGAPVAISAAKANVPCLPREVRPCGCSTR
jgi:hypothetical protein